MKRSTVALGLSLAAVALQPAAAGAKGLALQISEGGRPVSPGTEVGLTGTIAPQGREGSGQFGGAGPLASNSSRTDRWTARAAAGGGYQWKVEGWVSSLSLSSAGTALVKTKHLAISPVPIPPPPGPVPPPAAARVNQQECWYRLPGKLAGTFPLPGLAVITAAAQTTPSKGCAEPGFEATVTLTLQSEQLSGRPTLETGLAG
ncbi:MAG: hypothetical protein JWM60_2590 [Solirubrobacterales bacterium]|nr:hypothetical protein [Solirubrobacterales bacterium]